MRTAAFFDMDRTLLLVNSADRWGALGRCATAEAPRNSFGSRAGSRSTRSACSTSRRSPTTRGLRGYRGASEAALREKVAAWVRAEVLETLSMRARNELDARRARGDVCVLLTSATLYAAEPVARAVGIEHVLCSRLEVHDGELSGRHLRPLCYGRGKVAMAEQFARKRRRPRALVVLHGLDFGRSDARARGRALRGEPRSAAARGGEATRLARAVVARIARQRQPEATTEAASTERTKPFDVQPPTRRRPMSFGSRRSMRTRAQRSIPRSAGAPRESLSSERDSRDGAPAASRAPSVIIATFNGFAAPRCRRRHRRRTPGD